MSVEQNTLAYFEQGTLNRAQRRALKKSCNAVVVFDWSIRRGVVAVHDGKINAFASLTDMADHFRRLCAGRIAYVGETTFESFDLSRRAAFIRHVEADGDVILCLPNRNTGKAKAKLAWALGLTDAEVKKTDTIDALALLMSFADGTAVRQPTLGAYDKASHYGAAYEATKHELMFLRSHGHYIANRNGKPVFVSLKETLAETVASLLPDINTIPEEFRAALACSGDAYADGSLKGYNMTNIAAVTVLAAHCHGSRRLFTRVAGLHHHGYGCQARADFHHHVWAGSSQRGKIWQKKDIDADPALTADMLGKRRPHNAKGDAVTWKTFRKALWWLHAEIRSLMDAGYSLQDGQFVAHEANAAAA